MAKAKNTPPADEAPPAVAHKNVPFTGAGNRVLTMVHAEHGEAQVGDWQVEEFAALGWTVK